MLRNREEEREEREGGGIIVTGSSSIFLLCLSALPPGGVLVALIAALIGIKAIYDHSVESEARVISRMRGTGNRLRQLRLQLQEVQEATQREELEQSEQYMRSRLSERRERRYQNQMDAEAAAGLPHRRGQGWWLSAQGQVTGERKAETKHSADLSAGGLEEKQPEPPPGFGFR